MRYRSSMLNAPSAPATADSTPAIPYDEMLDANHAPRPRCRPYQSWLAGQSAEVLTAKRAEAKVYGDGADTERLIPFDIIPRIIPQDEWRTLAAELKQRVRTLNAFIHDGYHDQNILKAGVVPGDSYAHIAGVDVIYRRVDSGPISN